MSSTSLRSSAKRPRLSADSQPPPVIGWSCPACTFLNPNSAFKCQVCECRKGTSTRISSTVDNGAIELQRSIQEQIERTKRQGRRSDSVAGQSDSHGNSHRQHGVKTEEDSNSIDESWRLLGDSSPSLANNNSNADSLSSSEHDNVTNRRNRAQRRLSPTPSPSPQPPASSSKPTSSSKPSNSASKNGANGKGSKPNGTIPKGTVKMEENEKELIPASSASSCCSSSVVLRNNGKGKKATANGKSNGKSQSLNGTSLNSKLKWPRLQNVNRLSARETSVTVRGVTVVITDYDPV